MSNLRFSSLAAGLGLAAALCVAPVIHAYDGQRTHAGIAAKAAHAAKLHTTMVAQMGLPLGLFEPLTLDTKAAHNRVLLRRLARLDPAFGYRPDETGRARLQAWLAAGAALATVPAERGRHHFFNPKYKEGLSDDPGLTGSVHALRLAVDKTGGLRDLGTGEAFDLTGMSSLQWLRAPQNDLSLNVFWNALERSASAPNADAREDHLVKAALALGAMTALLSDAGDPAHVRNDFRIAMTNDSRVGAWDRRPGFATFVGETYGLSGIPSPVAGPTLVRPSIDAFFSAPDGQGLADLTHRAFFSDGTVPAPVLVDEGVTPRQVRRNANLSLPFALPVVPPLDLQTGGVVRYVRQEGRRLLAYRRTPQQVEFFLDRRVYEDTARVLLPQVTAYVAGFIAHLFRVRIEVTSKDGRIAISAKGFRGGLHDATLRVMTENQNGHRRTVGSPMGVTADGGDMALTIDLPKGVKKIAVSLRGQDDAGTFVAVAAKDL